LLKMVRKPEMFQEFSNVSGQFVDQCHRGCRGHRKNSAWLVEWDIHRVREAGWRFPLIVSVAPMVRMLSVGAPAACGKISEALPSWYQSETGVAGFPRI